MKGRLFIDASKLSLKAVLLNNGNELPSISVTHVVYMKETYRNLKDLLEMINYSKYGWQICADLKVVCVDGFAARIYKVLLFSLSMGQQSNRFALHQDRLVSESIF
ncbi:hypothetical protein AVEN_29096-1 [Araneus ventricosus]|uniref:Uncharacterized protein n=1 Tax=Araneus ventricosus TaxID=182803 RepID=A0A4Y2AJN9_ARAVE|nr:hypothetical protein AVEN_29096-1 [Araneus ventricosus]